MTCTCCFTCKWVYRPYCYIASYALRGLVRFAFTVAKLKSARMRMSFPPDRKFSIPSSKGRRLINVNMYIPAEGENKKYPVHINLYGSGFIFSNAYGADAEFCRDVCREAGAIVLDCSYAVGKVVGLLADFGLIPLNLAPENPFPAAYDDVSDVVAHVFANPQGRYDSNRLTISGFSAGGALSLAISATMPQNTFKAVAAFYPMTNLTLKHRRKMNPPPGEVELPPGLLRFYCEAYAPHSVDQSDPRLSPHSNPASAFPDRIALVVCEYDTLRDEAVEFGRMLKEGGKHVDLMDVPGASHGWDKIADDGTAAGRERAVAYEKVIQVLRDAYR